MLSLYQNISLAFKSFICTHRENTHKYINTKPSSLYIFYKYNNKQDKKCIIQNLSLIFIFLLENIRQSYKSKGNWGNIFPVWLRNRFISAGLEPVLRHTVKSCIVSH